MSVPDHITPNLYVHPDDPAYRLTPGDSLMVDGLDWSWAFVYYKDLPGYPGYCAGSNGTVWSCRLLGCIPDRFGDKWTPLRPSVREDDGYLQVVVKTDVGKWKTKVVHRLVALTFLGERPELLETCHNNGKPYDCRLINIRYGSRIENQADRIAHGTSNRGARARRVRLSESQVIEIKRALRSGVTMADLSRKYNVHFNTIRGIKIGASWSYVTEEHAR